jgi:hypothetical protein
VKVVVNGKDVPYTARRRRTRRCWRRCRPQAIRSRRHADREDVESLRYLQAAGRGGDRAAVHPGDLRHHGVRADRGDAGRTVPDQIRYTSMSLPYHIGNGWFGGLLPATAFAIVASTGDIYAGLWYPIIFASITAVVGFFFLPETKDVDITK